PGALNGWRQPWYAAALVAATILAIATRRRIGQPARIGRGVAAVLFAAGAGLLLAALFSRLPPRDWVQLPFQDDWTPLYQSAVNGVRLPERRRRVGWSAWL